MKQYQELLQTVLEQGTWSKHARTGIRTISLPGLSARFDLAKGFPAVTTKKLPFKSVMAELVGFLRAVRSAADFRALGTKVWDQNANENAAWLANPFREGPDDLGDVYGVQWRSWPAYKVLNATRVEQVARSIEDGFRPVTFFEELGERRVLLHKQIDQLRQCLDTIMSNPSDRRILFHGWNPAKLGDIALPACHLLYQFHPNPERRELSMTLYLRSNDLGLGAPFNAAEAAALLHLVARLTGYTPRWLTYFIGDAHIYENHLEMVRTVLAREPLALPQLVISERVPAYAQTGQYEPQWLEKVEPTDFMLEGYAHHPPVTAPMAV